MPKKQQILTLSSESGLTNIKSLMKNDEVLQFNSGSSLKGREIEVSLNAVIKQMRTSGKRERTIYDYKKHVKDYQKRTGHKYLTEISVDSMYYWLDQMDGVKNSTKLIRLKSFKAVLGRFYNNGWLESEFWKNVTIKVDKNVKKPATEKDVMALLSALDLTRFTELRDATAILLMYKTGVRLATMSNLKEEHVNFEEKMLYLSGDIMKNHNSHRLPITDDLCVLMETLIQHNKVIRENKKQKNNYIFITINGLCVQRTVNNNVIQKRIRMYSKMYGFENLSPHALRRGFATNLLKQEAPLPLISKALHHSDLSVTSVYLDMEEEQVANDLKKYL